MEDLDLALSGLEKVHKVVNDVSSGWWFDGVKIHCLIHRTPYYTNQI